MPGIKNYLSGIKNYLPGIRMRIRNLRIFHKFNKHNTYITLNQNAENTNDTGIVCEPFVDTTDETKCHDTGMVCEPFVKTIDEQSVMMMIITLYISIQSLKMIVLRLKG